MRIVHKRGTAEVLTAEVVAIGTEILSGAQVDTNSAWLSNRLSEIGVAVHYHSAVDDDETRIADVLRAAAGRVDVVIVTGGIGPTPDDRTRYAVARFAAVELIRRDELVAYLHAYFSQRGRDMPASNLVQADLPAGAWILPAHGTAAGFAMNVGESTIYCLPGVPREMRAMMEASVLPALGRRAGGVTRVTRYVRTAGMAESAVAELTDPVARAYPAVTVGYLASRAETRVSVSVTASDRSAAMAGLEPVIAGMVARLGRGVVGLDDHGPEHQVLRVLGERGLTLGIVESMTAGAVCARIARVPGASRTLRGGLVVYATDVKMSVAGVDETILDQHGPVSKEVSRELAVAGRTRLGADIGLAVVGVAGPTTQGGKPVGRVHLCVATQGGEAVHRQLELGNRERGDILDFSVSTAIEFLRRTLAE